MRYSLVLCNSALVLLLLALHAARVSANDSPGFFLKVTKNVPRLGRRSDATFNPERVKRMLLSPAAIDAAVDRELSVVQPVSSNTLIELLEQNLSDNMNFVFWKDFDRALQLDSDLYAKVMSLGRKPDHNLKADLRYNNYGPAGYNSDMATRGGGGGGVGGGGGMYHGKDDGLVDVYAGKYERFDNNYNNL